MTFKPLKLIENIVIKCSTTAGRRCNIRSVTIPSFEMAEIYSEFKNEFSSNEKKLQLGNFSSPNNDNVKNFVGIQSLFEIFEL